MSAYDFALGVFATVIAVALICIFLIHQIARGTISDG